MTRYCPGLLATLCFGIQSSDIHAGTFEEETRSVLLLLHEARVEPDDETPSFVFGSFPVEPEALPVAEAAGERVPEVAPETPPPSFKARGTLRVRGQWQVFINNGGHSVGSQVDGYEITSISRTEITVTKGGKTFSLPSR